MMPITPSGCGRSSVRPGRNSRSARRRRGFIQRRPLASAWRIADRLGNSSSSSVSWRGRQPKSALIASVMPARLSRSIVSSARRRMARVDQSGIGCRRCAARIDCSRAMRSDALSVVMSSHPRLSLQHSPMHRASGWTRAEHGTIASEPGTQLESTRRLTRQVPAAASRDKPGDVAHKRHANRPMRLPAPGPGLIRRWSATRHCRRRRWC